MGQLHPIRPSSQNTPCGPSSNLVVVPTGGPSLSFAYVRSGLAFSGAAAHLSPPPRSCVHRPLCSRPHAGVAWSMGPTCRSPMLYVPSAAGSQLSSRTRVAQRKPKSQAAAGQPNARFARAERPGHARLNALYRTVIFKTGS